MKILLYCPLYPDYPHIHDRTLESILNLDFDGALDIVFGRKGKREGPGHAYFDLVDKHNHARQLALDGNYDALMFVEADMVIHRSALKKLIDVDADIAYGLYVSRHKPHQWLAYSDLSGRMGASLSFDRDKCSMSWGKVVKTMGVGMGCTLIRRHVLHAIEFRCPSTNAADDWYFALDAVQLGFCQKHHLGVVCGHIEGNRIFWPERNGGFSIQYLDEYFTTTASPSLAEVIP